MPLTLRSICRASCMPTTDRGATGMPQTAEHWDVYVRAQRSQQGLAAELSADLAADVVRILIRSTNPVAARGLARRHDHRRTA